MWEIFSNDVTYILLIAQNRPDKNLKNFYVLISTRQSKSAWQSSLYCPGYSFSLICLHIIQNQNSKSWMLNISFSYAQLSLSLYYLLSCFLSLLPLTSEFNIYLPNSSSLSSSLIYSALNLIHLVCLEERCSWRKDVSSSNVTDWVN